MESFFSPLKTERNRGKVYLTRDVAKADAPADQDGPSEGLPFTTISPHLVPMRGHAGFSMRIARQTA
jgi:hypothetical protein